jgi:hypothetical protein
MKLIVSAAVSALAAASSVIQPGSASAQDFRPNRVIVDYIEPRDTTLQGVYERMKQSQVLEEFAQFLAPLRLPTTLRIWGVQCYEMADWLAYYEHKDHAIHFCYEFVARLEKERPSSVTPEGFTPEQAFVGALVSMMLHETGHAVVDLLNVPVLGREEDAADQIAEFIGLQFDKDLEETVTKGAAWYWLSDVRSGMMYFNDYADVHSTSMERFLNYLCLGYGGDPDTFKDLADKFLKTRAPNCAGEYRQVEKAFKKTVLPYIDPELMQQVRSKQWFAASKFE